MKVKQIILLIFVGLFVWVVWLLGTGESADAQSVAFNHHFPWTAGISAEIIAIDECREYGCNVKTHANQIDFGIQANTSGEVVASKAGTVAFVKESSYIGGCDYNLWQYANMVVLWHEFGEYSWYVHLAPESVPVYVGQQVEAGTVLGTVGMTGNTCSPHLHYMVTRDHWAWTDPDDASKAPWATEIRPTNFVEVPWEHLYSDATYLSQNDPITSENQWQKVRLWSDQEYDGIVLWEGDAGFNNGPDGLGYALELPDGWSAITYAYDNRWGGGTCVRSTVPNLEWIGWQNAIRSIDVFDYNICGE